MEKSVETTEVPAVEEVTDGDTLEYSRCRARGMAFLISVGLHVVLLLIAGMVVFDIYVRQRQKWLVCRNEVRDDRFYDVPRNSFVRFPRIEGHEPGHPESLVMVECEEVEDYPHGMMLDNLANKNLEGNSCVDAFGIAGGRSGAYGKRWKKGRASPLDETCDRSPG